MTDWNKVVCQHGPTVWKTASRLLSNHADVSDCYQKVFLDAIRVSRREPVQNWRALLRRLATARALDMLRYRYRSAERTQGLDNPASVISNHPGPQEQATNSELADCLREALSTLPVRQAEVFCAIVMEGMTYREVAERFDMDSAAVGMLLHRARTRLRKKFASLAALNVPIEGVVKENG